MHLCIFKAACWIDRVLIVFPGVLEGSARGIDQSQTRPLTLGGWQGPSLCCMQREMQAEVMAGQGRGQAAHTGGGAIAGLHWKTKFFN